jgi:hypothetical protein
MKPSEFYEIYWRVDYGDGKWAEPPKLSDEEKDFLDNAANGDYSRIVFTRKRRRKVEINIDVLKEQMKKLPPYFIPANQPKLDEFGNILDEPATPLRLKE